MMVEENMDIRLDRSLIGNPLEALRRAGYFPFRDPKSGEESFVCRLGPDFYPRFHLYLKEQGDTFAFSLHLDQKQASYGGSHMHNGEYEGELIGKEMERIRGWIVHVREDSSVDSKLPQNDTNRSDREKPWWQFWK